MKTVTEPRTLEKRMTPKKADSPAKNRSSKLAGISEETLLKWFEEMLLIRRFEEKCAQLYGMGKIGGFCHLYIGQESVSTGSMGAIGPDDYVITAYRDHGQAISKGIDPKKIMAEMLGKYTGTTKGKGGSMHLFDREKNFLGGHAIVGGHLPIATGVAFAIKYKNEKKVILCFLGDGATNIGAFHESLNIAGLWKLPVIFIIENNNYGMGTSVERSSAITDLHTRALSYGIRNDVVDGHDVIAVHNSVKSAAEHARKTYEPSLLEMRTFRYRGHSMSDPTHGHYRTKEELESNRKLDPIEIFTELLKEHNILDDLRIDEVEKKIKMFIQECVEFAERSPEPPLHELYTDVYKDSPGD